MVFTIILPLDLVPAVSGQHHGAPPPAANIGDRKIALEFETQPNPIKIGQDVEIKISFADETVKKNVNHVTFHTDISKDGKRLLSEFFHSHEGNVNLSFKDTIKATSTSTYTIGANLDMLTNAWIADPGNSITIRGGEIFSQPGTYKAVIEVTTMDNDKTDLPQPILYEINIPVL
ncbi:MAG: hypothetical protein WAM88_07510 [Nitrososphaeraceae archaeon]